MAEERSPCLECERLENDKFECADSGEKLEKYKERLCRFSLWRGGCTTYELPGGGRRPVYRNSD
ncbi:MAG: hypothetical protein JSU72_07185 [Deltaproteobacteria bacterium]|nr:MAG: hypothetical protein JSU72_07185 [Deltaproteobacteria bacterium]